MARKIIDTFTKEEIKALKEVAREILFKRRIIGKAEYRNRFETWNDAYTNLKASGFNHKEIIKRIGERNE